MKTIILPTDFSKNADRAMEFAIAMAKKLNAQIVGVNAFDLPYSQNVMSTSLLDIMKETSEKGLEEVGKKIKESGVAFHARSMMGNPIRVVKELSKYYEDCMVVMGTKGASGMEEVLIGSNAASILHSVEVPVLAIPKKAKVKDFKKIVYASDFKSIKNDTALERLAKIACGLDIELNILHVQAGSEKPSTPQRDKFEKYLNNCKVTYHTVSAGERTVEQSILDFANEVDADMIALLARKYGFLEGLFKSSMTSKVAFHTTRPFLALHEL